MKWLSKQIQRSRETRHVRNRLSELREEIGMELGFPVRLQHNGRVSGFDSIFRIFQDRGRGSAFPVGMLRLNNSLRCQTASDAGLPRIRLDGPARITHEATAYHQLHEHGLAPAMLMKGDDFLVNEWLSLEPFSSVLRRNEERIWQWLPIVLQRIRDMHALQVVHMDLNPGNILVGETRSEVAFIDFEYAAAPSLPLPARQCFDFLRCLSNLLKPRRAIRPLSAEPQRMLDLVDEVVPADCRRPPLPFGLEHFPGISRCAAIQAGIRAQFSGLSLEAAN